MIQAGYIPIELLIERLRDVGISQDVTTGIKVTMTLDGEPGAPASMYRQAPFSALLQALNERMQ